tara:strand:- start:2972 stop:3175 length:204 start_codon:yes stop_codon:yes gene_type:complete
MSVNAYFHPRIPPPMIDKRSKMIKIKKIILAIPAAPAAMPPKPKMAAIRAIIKNKITKRNITSNFKG